MSAPAVKAFGPAPVITMTRVPESRSSSWRARTSSAFSIIDIAFNLSGRFSVMSVVDREQSVLEFAFQCEALVERHLRPFGHGPFDESDRAAGVLRVAQTLREGHRLLPEFRPRKNAVEEAPIEGLLRGDHAAGRHEVDRAALPNEAG